MEPVIILLVSVMIYGYFHMQYKYDDINRKLTDLQKKKLNQKNNTINVIRDVALLEQVTKEKDARVAGDPLTPPERRNMNMLGREINIPTRGDGGPYQQLGTLYKESNVNQDGSSPGSNNDPNILPLYGKPTYRGSNHYNYYTMTANNVKIPISKNKTDCTDDRGCQEIYDGDIILLPEYNGNFKVKIYNYDKPRYIPYV